MQEPTILRSVTGRVATLTINRAAVRNAIDVPTIQLLGDEVRAVAHDTAISVLVITGQGDIAFSAGGDLREMSTFTALSADTAMDIWQATLGAIERSPKPVIAAINGFAHGGGTELAMACHIRVAVEHASLGQPEIALDHLPGAGGTQRLPRLVPLGIAYECLLTGDPIPASEAWRIGLVNHVWPADVFAERVAALAARIAARAAPAIRYTLEAVRYGLEGSLESGLRLERAMSGIVLETAEAQAGIAGFFAERQRRKTKDPAP